MTSSTVSPAEPAFAPLAPPETASAAGVAPSDRIGVLDVLRGIALLGMFVVHFTDASQPAPEHSASAVVHRAVELFFEERFWAMFAILFGVGFAVQLARADARGARFAPRYLRRALALLGFGLIAEVGFGYHVLAEYAVWGLPLLLVRRWPTRRLLVLLVACLASGAMFSVARTAAGVQRYGDEGWRARAAALAAADRATWNAMDSAQHAPRYAAVVAARLRKIPWWYAHPFFFLPLSDFPLFLVGLLGLRLGVFERPREHRRLIVGMMLFGVASSAATTWLLPRFELGPPAAGDSLVAYAVSAQLRLGLGLVRPMWLTFAYIGAVLLLVARDHGWLRRLAPFAWTGRMALTNYMFQVMVLDLTFSNYALGLAIPAAAAPVAALALFAVESTASRWWLARFRFGPLEWVWRSITYWKRQPLRLADPAIAVSAATAA